MNRLSATLTVLLIVLPAMGYAYPGGTHMYVTDTGPFCASCHSAVKAEYMPELPPGAAKGETPEAKHYGLVRSERPPSPYLELSEEQKEEVIRTARSIDEFSRVELSAPRVASPGSEVKVTVKATGGNGPVICVMLVDRALRFQSRPVSADGWRITGEPLVRGQDGRAQTTWLDKRIEDMKRNLNFVTVYGQSFDAAKKLMPSAEVTFTLKAPERPGTYTLAAAFLYGTENATGAAFFQRPSGRILFSEEHTVTVR